MVEIGSKNEKVLVTGASGFLGRAVVEALQDGSNFEVSGLIGKSSKNNAPGTLLPANLFSADISDYSTLKGFEESFKNIKTVIHTAGLAHQFGQTTKEDFWKVNVRGTKNVCNLAFKTGAEHFVLISSVSVYGNYGSAEIDESFECRPEGIYAESKLESESRAKEICGANGMRLTILRPSTIIGEGDRGNTARLIKMIDQGRFVWIGEGKNKKSLIYKKDVANAILKLLVAGKRYDAEVYNLTSKAVSMEEIVSVIAGSLRKKTPRLKIPKNLVRGFFKLNRAPFSVGYLKKIEKTTEKWLSDDIFSGREFSERFAFEPPTTISEALERQVDYYLKHVK